MRPDLTHGQTNTQIRMYTASPARSWTKNVINLVLKGFKFGANSFESRFKVLRNEEPKEDFDTHVQGFKEMLQAIYEPTPLPSPNLKKEKTRVVVGPKVTERVRPNTRLKPNLYARPLKRFKQATLL